MKTGNHHTIAGRRVHEPPVFQVDPHVPLPRLVLALEVTEEGESRTHLRQVTTNAGFKPDSRRAPK